MALAVGLDANPQVHRCTAWKLNPKKTCREKSLKLARRRELARWIPEGFAISVSQACRLALLRRSTWYRRSVAKMHCGFRLADRDAAGMYVRFRQKWTVFCNGSL